MSRNNERKAPPEEKSGPSAAQIHRQFQALNIGNDIVKARKTPGQLGIPTTLFVNSFPVDFRVPHVYRYVVEFEPEIAPEQVVRRRKTLLQFRAQLDEHYGVWVFDGTCLLAVHGVEDGLQFQLDGDDASIVVRPIKVIATDSAADLMTLEVNTLINVFLKKQFRILNLKKLGRNYFGPEPVVIEQYGICLYKGYSAAIEPSLLGLQLQVDAVHRVVRSKTVRDVMDEIEYEVYERYPNLSQEKQYQKIEEWVHKELHGASVLTSYNNALWRIDYVDWARSSDSTFSLKTGEDVSFRRYYAEKYQANISEVKYGVLVHIPKKRPNEEIILMPEFCHLTGLTDEMKSNYRLMSAIATKTRMQPRERLEHVTDLVRRMATSEEVKKAMDPMPFNLVARPTQVQARILGPFAVTMNQRGRNQTKQYAGAQTNFGNDLRRCGMVKEIPLKKWVVVADQRDRNLVNSAVSTIMKVAQSQGLGRVVAQPKVMLFEVKNSRQSGGQSKEQQWQINVGRILDQTNPQLILGIMSDRPATLYSAFKQVTTVNKPTISQVILTRNLKNPKKITPVCGNVLKQMLTKLGGVPWQVRVHTPKSSVRFNAGPSMVVGIDVCHDKKHGRSTVGFCASYSSDYSQFNSYISFQGAGVEIVGASQELMARAVAAFNRHHPLPQSILVYRDGVSNSQLDTVVKQEIMGFKKAFKQFQNYNPELTVVVVQKRVSARFFTADRKMQSPVPGTVIDTGVVSPLFSDFYLVPCLAHPNAGTATPTRFIVVWDDANFASDDIQAVTSQFCMLYYNWPGPIRVPAPCMYAHKIAFLVGKHIPSEEPGHQLSNRLFFL